MRALIWAAPARQALRAFLDLLGARNAPVMPKASKDILAAADLISRRIGVGHPARWEGLFEYGLPRWKKILVYRATDDAVTIVAFYDARQDLRSVDPND
jgi:plasmid stabilization system protein ParE